MGGDARWATSIGLVVACQVVGAGQVAIDLPHGGRLTGTVVAESPADAEVIRVRMPLFVEPLELPRPAAGESAEHDATAAIPGLPGRVGLLTAEGTRMYGCLVSCEAGQIGWQPLGCSRGAPFSAGGTARIDYRSLDIVGGPGVVLVRERVEDAWKVVDLPADGPAARTARIRVGDLVVTLAEGAFNAPISLRGMKADAVKLLLVGPIGSLVRFGVSRDGGVVEIPVVRAASGLEDLAGAAPRDAFDRAAVLRQSLTGTAWGGPATVHLVSGESFACTVLAADERTVRLRCGDHHETSLPADVFRAIEFVSAGVRPILRQKLARLLTVPRAQQASPPTHVVRMSGGDYLRGRLVGIDDRTVRFEVVGDVKDLPRRDVARIIRLASAAEPPRSLLAELSSSAGVPLVILGGEGRRRAVAATGLADGHIVGESPSLGETVVPLDHAAAVLVGNAINEVPAGGLPYAQWVLTPARRAGDGR